MNNSLLSLFKRYVAKLRRHLKTEEKYKYKGLGVPAARRMPSGFLHYYPRLPSFSMAARAVVLPIPHPLQRSGFFTDKQEDMK